MSAYGRKSVALCVPAFFVHEAGVSPKHGLFYEARLAPRKINKYINCIVIFCFPHILLLWFSVLVLPVVCCCSVFLGVPFCFCFLSHCSQGVLLVVGLSYGEDRLNPVELSPLWNVEEWRDAKVLHGLGGMLGGMHFEVVHEEGERLAFVLSVEQLQELDELLCCDGTFVA